MVTVSEHLEHPTTIGAPLEALHPDLLLRDDDVLLERRDGAVLLELLPPIVSLGGIGEDLDDQARGEQYITAPVLELVLRSEGDEVRIDPRI